MTHTPTERCQDAALYFVNELSEKEKDMFERHLQDCTQCQAELEEMRFVWDQLPYSVEEKEPPSDLKDQVLASIFPEEGASDSHVKKVRGGFGAIWGSGWTRAAVFALVIGLLWNNMSLRGQLNSVENQLSIPAETLQTYEMVAADPALIDASGKAWIVQIGNQRRLVVELNGLPSTQGEEVYQVWLIRDGVRRNAGTVQVGENGTGVLTYTLADSQFDQIGITREPDSLGNQPRGKKVLGTT